MFLSGPYTAGTIEAIWKKLFLCFLRLTRIPHLCSKIVTSFLIWTSQFLVIDRKPAIWVVLIHSKTALPQINTKLAASMWALEGWWWRCVGRLKFIINFISNITLICILQNFLTIPSKTFPKTTCLPSSQVVLAVVMKNWEPLVFLPALAIDNQPEP